MINDLFLIDFNDIQKLYGNWNENINPKLFKFPIIIGQDRFIRQSLTDDLYYDFMDKFRDFQDNSIALTPEYELLLETLKPVLIFGVLEETIFELQNQITNKGVMVRNSDFSNPVSDTNVYKLQYRYKDYRERYQKDLIDFLNNNSNDYPLFDKKVCKEFNKWRFFDVRTKWRPVR